VVTVETYTDEDEALTRADGVPSGRSASVVPATAAISAPEPLRTLADQARDA
jgi:hypothetical protein